MTNNFTDKNNKSEFYYKDNIETEYIGGEETEYVATKTGKIPKNIILNQRYKIVATIGKGGMGAVYKALDMRLRSTPVAIKEMSLGTIEDERIEKVIQNFENEAGTLISLRHNSIPRVMDFFSLNNNKCYIVMDLIEGETLDQVIRRRGKIPEYEVRDWINQIADVLKYLHSRDPKIIFRDLKPSNVMITKDNEIKLIDFGIARTFKDDKSEDTTYYVSQGFSPPEQYGTGQSDERSDIYSLGALTHSLLIGRKPKIKDFKFEDSRDFVDVSDELNNAIMEATDFRPDNRPQTIEDFMNLVNSDLKVKNPKRKSRKFTIVAASILIMVGLTAVSLNKNINKTTEDNISHKNKTANDNTSIVDTNSENISNDGENNPKIKKAIDTLYKVTNDSRAYTVFKQNQGDSYVTDPRVKKNYYIFNVSSTNGDLADFNYAVNKKDYSVYICPPGGVLIPYKDANSESNLGKYFSDYQTIGEINIPEATTKYLEKNGAEALNYKVNEILKDAIQVTIDHCGGPVFYVDSVLRGNTKEQLDADISVYTESGYNAETFLKSMFEDYEKAVEEGNPSLMYPHVTSDGESHKGYEKNIPKYHKRNNC